MTYHICKRYNSYLVSGTFELVDDSDVGDPGDNERHVQVDDAGRQHKDGVNKAWIAGDSSRWFGVHIRPDEHRDVECHVVDPEAHDDSGGHVHFETRSTGLAYAEESIQNIALS